MEKAKERLAMESEAEMLISRLTSEQTIFALDWVKSELRVHVNVLEQFNDCFV